MRNVKIEVEGVRNFEEVMLELLKDALFFGIEGFYFKDGDKGEIRLRGKEENIKIFYQNLVRNAKAYGIEKVGGLEDYEGFSPKIDTYLSFMIFKYTSELIEAAKKIERIAKDLKKTKT